jgi:hypothetical protein
MVVFSSFLMAVFCDQKLLMFLEVFHGIGKSRTQFDHDEINGIEVLFTSKAPCEIRFGIESRIEVRAERTEKSKVAVTDLPGYAEVVDDG